MEAASMSIDRWMDKEIVVHVYVEYYSAIKMELDFKREGMAEWRLAGICELVQAGFVRLGWW